MFGANPMGGGVGAMPVPAPPVVPAIPQAPSVPAAGMNQTNPASTIGSGNFFGDIMKAIFDPSAAAVDMAKAGVTPDIFTKQLQSGNLSKVMQASSRPASVGDVYTRNGMRIIQPGPENPGITAATGDEFIGQNVIPDAMKAAKGTVGELMKPITQGEDTAAIRQASIMGRRGEATPVVPPTLPVIPPQMQQPIVPPVLPQTAVTPTAPEGAGVLPVPPPQTIVGQDVTGQSVTGTAPQVGAPAISSPNATLATVGGEQMRSTPTAGAARFSASGMRSEIRELISKKALQYGLDPHEMQRFAMIESGGNPKAHNPSGASGIYQFIPGTWKQYGLGKDVFDPEANIDAGMRLAVDTRDFLRAKLGREPTYAEIYMGHQQGMDGSTKLFTNPDAKAADLVGKAAITGNGGKADWTAKQFTDYWRDRYNNFGGGGASMPGVSGAGAAGVPMPGQAAGAISTPIAPSGATNTALGGLESALDTSGGGQMDMNLPSAPSPVAPRQGQFNPSGDVMKVILAMLAPIANGGQVPTLSQLMAGR